MTNKKLELQPFRDLVAQRANSDILQAMGLGENHAFSSTTTAQEKGEELTEEKIKAAIEVLQSHKIEDQKTLIKLLSTIGFFVMVNQFTEKPVVMMPAEYKEALVELQIEQQNKEKELEECREE